MGVFQNHEAQSEMLQEEAVERSRTVPDNFPMNTLLVFPGFVAQWCAIEFLAVVLPERHESIHVGNELIVVVALEEVDHFVDDDVL